MHTFVLQDWTTIRGNGNTVVQSESEWLDLSQYQDLVLWIEVREVTGTSVTLTIQTSPTKDEAFFGVNLGVGIYQNTNLGASLGVIGPQKVLASTATIPLARYVRWTLGAASGTFDATFRIMISANAPGI